MAAQKRREIRIPEDAKAFIKMDFKKFKKKNKNYYDSKKEMKRDYFSELLYNLSGTIDFLLRYKHVPEENMQAFKCEAYTQLAGKKESPAFIKYISEVIKEDGVESIPNMDLFPIILSEIISDINRTNEEEKKKDPEAAQFDASELYDLNSLILKKKLKKAAKKGIDEDIAIDVLSIIPCDEAMKYSKYFRVKSLLEALYFHAKTKEVNFEKVVKLVIDEEYYDTMISYALQERKEKYQKFNDSQRRLFNQITNWVFEELEEMDKSTIQLIIENYVKARKKDNAAGKDGNRRYFLSSLPEEDFPHICKVVEQIKNKDPEAEKFL